ncbi:CvpA family protein [Asaia sp. HN010]|uniref:CvpA family protein n=1 Tax=Asaia sp. HN010 TaxID=3081233 RepID=UPI0030193471
MVPPHILDRLAESYRDEPDRRAATNDTPQKGKGRKKRSSLAVKTPTLVNLPDEQLRRDLAHAIVLVLVLSTIAQRFATGLRSVLVGGTDRLLGAGFGLVRGALVLVVLYLGVVSVAGEITAHALVAGSRSGPYILAGVHLLQGFTPYFAQLHLALPPAKGHDAAF